MSSRDRGHAAPGSPDPGPEPPPRVDGPAAFADAVRWAFRLALARPAQRVLCVDPDFAGWPLDDPALLDAWAAWLRPGRRSLLLLAGDWREAPRRLPRFVAWRAHWSHAVHTWAPSDAGPALPSVLVDDGPLVVERLDAVSGRGRAARDPAAARQWREEIDALLQRSEPSFAARPLGL